MRNLLTSIILLSLLIIIGLGYLGFIPIISNVFGSNKPKDLGIKYSQDAFDSGHEKSGVRLESLDEIKVKGETIVQIGKHLVKDSFTSEEVTAAAQNRKWVDYPFRQTQVRFNQDGTTEASGIIKFSRLFNYLTAIGVSSSDIEKGMDKFKIPKMDLPFYIKISGSVTDNMVQCNIHRFEIGKIPIPMQFITSYTPVVNRFLEDGIRRSPSYYVDSLSFHDGQVYFDGALPDIEATVNTK